MAIAGFGDSYATRTEPKTPLQLAAEAAHAALAAAGIGRDDVDGLLTGREPLADPRPQWNVVLAGHLGLEPTHTTQVTTHSAGAIGMLRHGLAAIEAGLAEHVLCVQADAAPLFVDPGSEVALIDVEPLHERPFGATPPSLYALMTRRYMHETGATEEDLARVAVAAQAWAVDHPHAAMRAKGPITVDAVLDSRVVADPLKLWDCAAWGPAGTGGAFVLTRADRAEALTDAPAYLLGAGTAVTHQYYGERVAQLVRRPAAETAGAIAARVAYAMAGIGPEDVDLVCPSTVFTSVGLMALEELGFCERGEAAGLVASGAIDPGGRLPFNTNGGWLSFGQPGTSCNMDLMVEALRQLDGRALGRQVPDCGTAVVHGLGGICSTSDVAVLGRARP